MINPYRPPRIYDNAESDMDIFWSPPVFILFSVLYAGSGILLGIHGVGEAVKVFVSFTLSIAVVIAYWLVLILVYGYGRKDEDVSCLKPIRWLRRLFNRPPKDWSSYHLPTCGTEYRGCDPECPKNVWETKRKWIG
jgi:hypothetical protein